MKREKREHGLTACPKCGYVVNGEKEKCPNFGKQIWTEKCNNRGRITMKIYIAGKITGDPNYKEKFNEAEAELKKIIPGSVILNPAILPEGLEEEDYMRITMEMLLAADAAVFLPDSSKSAGAMIEFSMCKKIGKPWSTFSVEKTE